MSAGLCDSLIVAVRTTTIFVLEKVGRPALESQEWEWELVYSSPHEVLVIEVPRWRVLSNPLFLQVLIDGINPNLRDGLPVLQETVVRADRDDEIAVRAYAHFEGGLEIRRPSFLGKNLHSFLVGDCRYRVGLFDNRTVAKLLASLCSVDPVLRPPL